jgi:hypothetical protein
LEYLKNLNLLKGIQVNDWILRRISNNTTFLKQHLLKIRKSTLNLPLQPPERLPDKVLHIRLHAGTVGDDQLVEAPREQPFEGSPGELPVRKSEPDIERNPRHAEQQCPAQDNPRETMRPDRQRHRCPGPG